MENKVEMFWKRVDLVLEQKGIRNLSAWCRENGISYITMVNTRSKGRIPYLENLLGISDALGVSLDYLIKGEAGDSVNDYTPESLMVAKLYMAASKETKALIVNTLIGKTQEK